MTLKEYVFDTFENYHRGKDYPTKRRELLRLLQLQDGSTTDREMRQAYKTSPSVGVQRGCICLRLKMKLMSRYRSTRRKCMPIGER